MVLAVGPKRKADDGHRGGEARENDAESFLLSAFDALPLLPDSAQQPTDPLFVDPRRLRDVRRRNRLGFEG